jgi:oligosaccharide repeat unit polymerase
VAVINPVLKGAPLPRFWPLLIGVLSAMLLFFVRPLRLGSTGLMRIGFHLGLFAFFVSFPLLYPEEINPAISEDVHWILGLALFLSLLGFELAYGIVGLTRRPANRLPLPLQPRRSQQRLLLTILGVGIAAWFFSVWDYASTISAPISSVLLAMRGSIEGSGSELARPGYLTVLMGGGIHLAAVAATLLLTTYRLSIRSILVCCLTLMACGSVGFLSGSRALFLYSIIPIGITGWRKVSALPFMTSIRWPGAMAAGVVLLVIWSAMTAMRGADIRSFEGTANEISPIEQAQGAFDIYSMTAVVVETFPDRIPYAQGESLIPLVLGWIPRSLWPSKPYPFGLYMNIINGETLEARSASLAVGVTGEGYGNFGLFGAFLWCFFLGVACRLGDRLMERLHPDDTLHWLLGGMSIVWVAMIVRGGVPEMFYMGLQVIALPLVLAIFLLPHRRRIRIGFRESVRISRQPTPY